MRKRIEGPALWIIAAVVFLLLLLGYYAYANHRREQDLMMTFLSREGQAFLQSAEAAIRTGMMEPMWQNKQLQELLNEIARHPDVIFLKIIDGDGRTLISSDGESDGATADILRRIEKKEVTAWMNRSGGIFYVAEFFNPLRNSQGLKNEMMMQRWQNWCRSMGNTSSTDAQIAVVGLYTERFWQAQQEDIRRAIGTGVVILLLGAAAFYFLFVTHNTYATRRALSETKSYAQNVVNSISNGVFSVDRQGRVVSINRIACDLLGMGAENAIGQYYYDLISKGDCRLEPTIEKGEKIVEKEMVCLSATEKEIEVSVSVSQLKDDEGVILGAVVVLRDMKEIRRLEEQLRRSERLASMGRMVTGVAHELRNPLSSIKGFARFFLRKFDETTEEGECSKLLIQETERLNRVISDMLNFAQPTEIRRTQVDFADIINHALLLCKPEIGEKSIDIERSLSSASSTVLADRDLLVQVLVNLFRNSIEAMDAEGRLIIASHCLDTGIELRVSDTGCGIADEDQARVFDPFFTTKKGGTGLGLAIAHSIIERHGGSVNVQSKPGEGTTFRVMLPRGG